MTDQEQIDGFFPKKGRTWRGGAILGADALFRHACGLRGKDWTLPQIIDELTAIFRRHYIGDRLPAWVVSHQISKVAESVMHFPANAIGNDKFWFSESLIEEMECWFRAQDRSRVLDEINSDLANYRTRTGNRRRITPIQYRHVALVALAIAKAMWTQISWNERLLDEYEIPHEFIKPCTGITDGIRIMAAIRLLEHMDFYRVVKRGIRGECDIYLPGSTSEIAPDALTSQFSNHPDLRTNTD